MASENLQVERFGTYASAWNQKKVVQQAQVLSSAHYLSWCSPGVVRHFGLAGHNLIMLLVV